MKSTPLQLSSKILTLLGVFSLAVLAHASGYTSAAYSDSESSDGNSLAAAVFTSHLTQTVSPAAPDGTNGYYKTTPCVAYTATAVTVGSTEIYHETTGDADPITGGSLYVDPTAPCMSGIPVADTTGTTLKAQAINTANATWTSNIISQDFKVDTVKPTFTFIQDNVDTIGATNPATGMGDVSVIINWTTDEDTSSFNEVVWGPETAAPQTYPNSDTSDVNALNHSITLTGLSINTTYHYKVRSTDIAGNTRTSADRTIDIASVAVTDDPDTVGDILLNEFIPNPNGVDDAIMPGGEWVELHNPTGSDINVAGWILTDNVTTLSHQLVIGTSNTNTSNTIVPAGGFLVVYRNGHAGFNLNNTSSDTVTLWKDVLGTFTAIDSYSYNPAVDTIYAGKSFARFPDGGATWIDPETTPGHDNQLKPEEVAYFQTLTKTLCFEADGSLKKDAKNTLCDPAFLVFIGMLETEKSATRINAPAPTLAEPAPLPGEEHLAPAAPNAVDTPLIPSDETLEKTLTDTPSPQETSSPTTEQTNRETTSEPSAAENTDPLPLPEEKNFPSNTPATQTDSTIHSESEQKTSTENTLQSFTTNETTKGLPNTTANESPKTPANNTNEIPKESVKTEEIPPAIQPESSVSTTQA